MINWTEEDVEYICTNILQPVLEVTIKGIAEEQGKLDDITDRMISSIGNAISEIKYEMVRDRRFILGFLSEYTHIKKDVIYDLYKSWCAEFDRLNKEKKDE